MQKDKDGSTSVNFSFLEGKREWVALKMESARYCASRSTVITIRFSPAPPLGTPLSDQTHNKKKGGRRKKHWQKKYENDKCIWPERAGTKLASSSTSLGHPQTYIYIGIYRRGREKKKKTDITFLSCVDTNIVLAPPLYKVKKKDRWDGNSHKSSVRVRFQHERGGEDATDRQTFFLFHFCLCWYSQIPTCC